MKNIKTLSGFKFIFCSVLLINTCFVTGQDSMQCKIRFIYDYGGLNTATHDRSDTLFVKKIQLFESLLKKYTWFPEGIKYSWKSGSQYQTTGSFEDGLGSRYGIEAMVYEFKINWIPRLNKIPSIQDWNSLGENLNKVFCDYVSSINK